MKILRALGVAGFLALPYVPAAHSQGLTPQVLVERAEILDQITRYYYNILRIVVQAREYATWEKVDGKWLYKKRNIFAGTKHPDWWKE